MQHIGALGKDHSKFSQNAAKTVHAEHALLGDCFDGHKAHRWTRSGFADRGGVVGVVGVVFTTFEHTSNDCTSTDALFRQAYGHPLKSYRLMTAPARVDTCSCQTAANMAAKVGPSTKPFRPRAAMPPKVVISTT